MTDKQIIDNINNFCLVCYYDNKTNELVRIEQYNDNDTSIHSDIESYKYGYNAEIIKPEQLIKQLRTKQQENDNLKKMLKNFLNCPRWCDESTVPQVVKSGLENQDKYAKQIVYNLSVSLSRILEAEQVLQKINEVENES